VRVDELTGTTIGRYRLSGRMQSLPYASVHRANVMADGQPVLMWTFQEPYHQAMGFLEALQRLAGDRQASEVPGMGRVLEIGTEDSPTPLSYLVSEDAGAGFLADLLREGRAPGVIATTAALARTLDGAHAKGLFHGDVQPATVALTSSGQILLTGFGIRTVVMRVTPSAPWIDATRAFRPPEAQAGHEPSRRADLYGLAALVYYLLVGRSPAAGAALVRPSHLRPQLSPAIDQAVMRALAENPAQRFGSASEFLAELRPQPAPRTGAAPATAAAPASSAAAAAAHSPGPNTPIPPPAPTTAHRSPVAAEATRSILAAAPASVPARAAGPEPPWSTAPPGSPRRSTSTAVSLVPLEPYEMEPEIRRRSGIILLGALVVLAAVLLALSVTGRLYF
jgi:serine/threonine protein kinase